MPEIGNVGQSERKAIESKSELVETSSDIDEEGMNAAFEEQAEMYGNNGTPEGDGLF